MLKVIKTSKDSNKKFEESFVESINITEKANLQLDVDTKYQEIFGFGGAFTEATAYTLSRMTKDKRDEVIKAYFHPELGLNYSIGRVHIHSCDFALGNYTYVDDFDTSLESFDISRDHKWVLPLIKDAMKMSEKPLEMLASPWSPPAWMKTNNEMNNGGQLKPEYFQTWATYYTKFIKAYENEGVNIWGITVQNEPAAVQTWDSCIYSPEEERDFVKNHLGPIMHKEGYEDKKILVWDHNRDIIVDRVKPIFEDPEAAKYVWGTGIHWYVSEAFENVGEVHNLFPDKHLLFTEGCQEGGVHLGSWKTGERYARNIIGDMNNWNEGFLDWNLVLDETGGPNHVNNLCDAPIIADTTTNELHYNSSYYYIGHFSKYIPRGSVRIGHEISLCNLRALTVLKPNNGIVMVLLNELDKDQSVTITVAGESYELIVKGRSIYTLIKEK